MGDESPVYGMRTRYICTVHEGLLDPDLVSSQLPIIVKSDEPNEADSPTGSLHALAGSTTVYPNPINVDPPVVRGDVYVLGGAPDQPDGAEVCSWVTFDEFDFLRSPEGLCELQRWLP